MSQVCDSIDTLSMSYLDEELAPEEKRELELHLLDCPPCRGHVHEERQEVEMLRQRLAVPPTPEVVRAKTLRMLDREDAQVGRTQLRERLTRWLLPTTSLAAAAAALLVFVFARAPSHAPSLEGVVASRQVAPLEVTGEATQSWLQQEIAGTMAPRFEGIELRGGNRLQINGRQVAQLVYEVTTTGPQRFSLEAYLFRIGDLDVSSGEPIEVLGRTLHISNAGGVPCITYRDEARQLGYLFLSRDLSGRALLDVVARADLIGRAGR